MLSEYTQVVLKRQSGWFKEPAMNNTIGSPSCTFLTVWEINATDMLLHYFYFLYPKASQEIHPHTCSSMLGKSTPLTCTALHLFSVS